MNKKYVAKWIIKFAGKSIKCQQQICVEKNIVLIMRFDSFQALGSSNSFQLQHLNWILICMGKKCYCFLNQNFSIRIEVRRILMRHNLNEYRLISEAARMYSETLLMNFQNAGDTHRHKYFMCRIQTRKCSCHPHLYIQFLFVVIVVAIISANEFCNSRANWNLL